MAGKRLIRYAGYDEHEGEPSKLPLLRTRSRYLKDFRAGMDTAEMAKLYGIPESRIEKQLTIARCRFHGLPPPEFLRRAR